MKVLYANPIFLDYRLPFYNRLNELFDGEFYVMYSPFRYKGRFDSLLKRIEKDMSSYTIPFKGEKVFNTTEMAFRMCKSGHGFNIPIVQGLIRAVRRVKPDVLISEGFFQWTPWMIVYAMLFRIPLFIGYERTPFTERNNGILKTLHRRFCDLFITGYLVNGQETTKYLRSIGIKESKIKVGGMNSDSSGLNNAISQMSEDEKIEFKSIYKKKDGIIFLFVGQTILRKGLKELLEAWVEHTKIHPNDVLIAVGTGDLLEKFREQYKNNDSIRLEGRVEYNTIHRYYAIADVFILPTLEDNWSLVVPEAMGCGLPVATTIYNGCHPELVVKDKNGYVFDSRDKNSIIECLDYFHHVDLKKFGQESIKLEKPFNTENCARREYEGIMSLIKR